MKTRTPEEIERYRAAYLNRTYTVAQVFEMFDSSYEELLKLRNLYDWPSRRRWSRTGRGRRRRSLTHRSGADYDASIRIEHETSQRELYGELYDDVLWLRRCGFAVFRDKRGVMVGAQVLAPEDIRRKADLWRRVHHAPERRP